MQTIAVHLRQLVVLSWLMILLVCFTTVASLAAHSDNINRLTLIVGPARDANIQVRQAMSNAQSGLDAYQASGDRALLQPYFGSHDQTVAALATLQDRLAAGGVNEAEVVRNKALGERQALAAKQWWADALLTEQALSAGHRRDLVQSRALFDRFSAANATLDEHLTAERDATRLEARMLSGRGEGVAISVTLVALLAMLLLGNRVAGTISRPLTELRDAMVRQREGELDARAREDQGSVELRSLAADFNALTDQNVALQQIQSRDLDTHQTTLAIARAIRAASETQQALDVMCAALGEGLGADRVVAETIGPRQEVQLNAQWHQPNLRPLSDLALLPGLGALSEQTWLTAGFWAQEDILAADEPAEGLGRTVHELAGARALVMVPIGLDDRVVGMIGVCMVGEPRAWTMAEITVVQAVSGFVARAFVAVEQQANQREYVSRIRELDRQKSDFLATVSHELRTPLTSISGYLEVLQDQEAGELTSRQAWMLEVISRNTVRLRSLIEDVMVLSRIEGGFSRANFVEVSIRGLVTRVCEELSPLARSSNVDLEIDAGPREAIVLGDAATLDRAVVNILSNAIKFSRHGGVVAIGCSLDLVSGRVLITCRDHGVGIPAQDVAHLFTRFFRASNAMEQAIPGTGLGLSIVRQIVEDHHGGQVRLTSVENEGTTVVMVLPLYDPSQAVPAQETAGNDSVAADVFGIRA